MPLGEPRLEAYASLASFENFQSFLSAMLAVFRIGTVSTHFFGKHIACYTKYGGEEEKKRKEKKRKEKKRKKPSGEREY